MRSTLLPLTLVLGLVGGAALADQATGVIKSYDAKTHMVTLEDGTSYKLHKHHHGAVKAGQKVMITFKHKGKVNDASALKAMK